MALRMAAKQRSYGRPHINLAGAARTSKPEAPTTVPTEDVGFLDVPPSVLVIMRASGVTSYNDFAWSWNEDEFRKELEKGGVVLGEIDRAVRQLTSARASSVEAMGSVSTSSLPRAVCATGQPCAPVVGKAAKVRKVHLHGVAAPSTGQLCTAVGVRAAPSDVKRRFWATADCTSSICGEALGKAPYKKNCIAL